MTATEADCGTCTFRPGYCDDHEVPPVCVCDVPATSPDCGRCGGHVEGMCHGCHRPVGEKFAAVRQAWREHLAGRAA